MLERTTRVEDWIDYISNKEGRRHHLLCPYFESNGGLFGQEPLFDILAKVANIFGTSNSKSYSLIIIIIIIRMGWLIGEERRAERIGSLPKDGGPPLNRNTR